MRTRAAAVAVAVLAVVGMTAGCSERPGVAAVVDGHEITQAELDSAAAQIGLLTEQPNGAPVDASIVLGFIAEAGPTTAVAEKHGVPVSDDDIRKVVDGVIKDASLDLEADALTPETLDAVRFLIARQGLANLRDDSVAAELSAAYAAADIDVNPRFGTWNARTGVVDKAGSADWIYTPAPTEQPTASTAK